ncbi:Starch-binding associating with outer membrane [Chitinophaga jiangningensis]|uniref:Starch-binding associating with outer membrane n=1 Tax=Chitinophaga jiangningensis TaxID=1419482 RepID=A0A1M6VN38_9BACT|nr:RagB/SusD family nutrient uptake outer membrane protein [Chitinophaga jiangningensis]SHK82731.1 Starch-binding associating with outer membrane [Chitinophaga jiangningensis]
MKKIYFLLTCAGFLAAGCNKSLLDTTPHDRYYEETYWQTPEAANAALVSCYSVLRNAGVYGGKTSNNATALWEETLTPNAYNQTDGMSFNTIARGTQMSSTGGIITSRYGDCYSGIGRCNTFLVKVDEVTALSEANRRRMKGEAYFLRALYYFMLQNYYGGVPLVLDPPERSTQAKLPRNSREEVIGRVLIDLDSATKILPVKFTGGDVGRATKGAAMALKARVLLYEASPLLNPSNDVTKWKAAADAAAAVMNEPGTGYGLFKDYRSLFLQPNENNLEVIFDVQYVFPQQGSSFDLICSQYNTNAPLLDLAKTYYTTKGLPITDPASGYDAANPYKNRDPRLNATFTYPGDTYKGEVINTKRFAITGYGMKKFSMYDKEAPPADKSDLKDGQSDINFIVLRFADILMMYAEAQNEVSGPDATIFAALNRIRDRVGMPHFNEATTKEALREEIRHERRVEFAGEGLYYNDIRRWKTAETVMNATIQNYAGKNLETRTFDKNRDYWWPIPLGERDVNPNLEQNTGY